MIADIIDRLACPITGQRLAFCEDGLITKDGKYVYPIKDGVPILLPERAKKVE